ncbi:hypothetical protein GCM10009754_65790 [Amycolatopsis minnesotensis]|uniref:BatC protein n=1 Tax=Amycolatopsis minnesotensis TaxID=337894 RepID=A0ABN2S431_9PSEU
MDPGSAASAGIDAEPENNPGGGGPGSAASEGSLGDGAGPFDGADGADGASGAGSDGALLACAFSASARSFSAGSSASLTRPG